MTPLEGAQRAPAPLAASMQASQESVILGSPLSRRVRTLARHSDMVLLTMAMSTGSSFHTS